MIVEGSPSIALDPGAFQKGAEALYEILFVLLVEKYSLTIDTPCDHMMEGTRCVDS